MHLSLVCFQSTLPLLAVSFHLISSPQLSAFCSRPAHTILGPQLPPPPEYAVKLCFPLLDLPVPCLPTLLSNPITEEGCLLRLAGDDCLTTPPGAKALCNEGHGYQETPGWRRAISQLSADCLWPADNIFRAPAEGFDLYACGVIRRLQQESQHANSKCFLLTCGIIAGKSLCLCSQFLKEMSWDFISFFLRKSAVLGLRFCLLLLSKQAAFFLYMLGA